MIQNSVLLSIKQKHNYLLGFLLTTVLSYVICTAQVPAQTESLPRQAFWGMGAAIAKPGEAVIRRIDADSPATKAGLKTDDVISQINGKTFSNQREYETLRRTFRSGDTIALRVKRAEQTLDLKMTLVPLPKETIAGADVIYDSATTEQGYRVRTIVTKPQNAAGKIPAIMLVQWLSCSPIEAPLRLTNGWTRVLRGLAEKSGFALVRVEKPGLGDSEGASCSENDLKTDMAAYRAALKKLKTYDFVDQNNVFLLGASLGTALAPIIAEGENIRGLIVSGGFTKTWYEHMLEIERNRLDLSGRTPGEINQAMRPYAEFYTMYLNGKMIPAQIIEKRPDLKAVWIDEPAHQYGRPVVFYHQAQDLNVESAWEKINVPVLVLYGEYDWIMSRADHELIANIVNRKNSGKAKLVILPKTDHSLDVYESREKAFRSEGGKFDESVVQLMLDWLKQNAGRG